MASVKTDSFTNAKERARELLDLLQHACKKYEGKIPIDTRDVQDKVARVQDRLEQQVFEVAFFGAFSDGKSTIIAALTKSLDIPISVDPTTNRVERYRHGDWLFVDTPGAFSDELEHDKDTRSYISEADLVVFVVNAVNPLPKSQGELVRWLLVDLKKEPHVIFAINRMDEIADLEDETDFENHVRVKRQVLLQTLQEICGRPCDPEVVAISADPYEQGLGDWLENIEEYERLSRLQSLIVAIEEHLGRAAEQIQANAGMASVRDGIETVLNRLEDLRKHLQPVREMLAQQEKELAQERDRLEQLVNEAYLGIKEDVEAMRRNLFDGLDACVDQRALQNLIERDIGEDGMVLERKITNIVERWGQSLTGQAKPIIDGVAASMEENDDLFSDLMKRGGPELANALQKIFGGNTRQIADGAIRIRDALNIPIKFKPWGAVKLAKWLKGIFWLAPLLEGLPIIVEEYQERKLRSSVTEFKDMVDQALKEFYGNFTGDEFERQACPALAKLRQTAKEQEADLLQVRKELRIIDKADPDFRNLRNHGWK